ncbi:MAG: MIP/aquaporin family protein [Streptosporangiales bacterium]
MEHASGGDQRPVAAAQATVSAFGAEVIGTFMFTFSGTATVLAVHVLSPHKGFNALDDVAISLAFALGVVAAVYTVASISGAHINPAVTIALAVVGKFPWRQVPVYLAAQFIGGILAALVNWYLFGGRVPSALILGSTHPGAGVPFGVAMFTEFVITLLLMLVVMATAVFERATGGARTAGLSIGLWVGAAIFLALPVSGGSLNPARTIGPDIVAGQFPYWWIYFVGPIAGAVAGAAIWRYVLGKGSKQAVEQTGA